MDRRHFLGGSAIGALLFFLGSNRLVTPSNAAANSILQAAFDARSEAEALVALFGTERSHPSDRINLSVPFVTDAALGAQIKIWSAIESPRAIAIMIRNSEHPLAAFVRLKKAPCFFATDIKVAKTTPVIAHVLTTDGLHSASKTVKVTNGGYGIYAH